MTVPERMIDANANRAREAMRVLEDIARFGLDDAGISGGMKSLRDRFRSALDAAGLSRASLSAARDTPGDVGTTLTAPGEVRRESILANAEAAGARLSEALRVVEESLKVLGKDARSVESIRYTGYELERQLLAALAKPDCDWRLCVLITESLCRHHSWSEVSRLAIEGGADCIQLREKDLTDRELIDRAKQLVDLAGDRASVIVNDRVDIALAAGAAGAHLGQQDLSIAEARQLSGPKLILGVSCTTAEQARSATLAGADILGIGAMYPTETKSKPSIAGPSLLKNVLDDEITRRIPHLAIGGIDADRVTELAALGCRGVAVSSAVCASSDPRGVCERIRSSLASAEPV